MESPFAFLLPAYMAVFAIVFAIVWRWYKGGALAWAFGYLWAATGFALPLLLDPPGPAVGMAADTCFVLAFLGFSEGLLHHVGRLCDDRRLRLAIGAGALVACGYAIFGAHSLTLEFAASDISCGLMLVPALIAMRRRLALAIDRALFGVTALVALETTGRGLFVLVAVPTGHGALLAMLYGFEMQAVAAILGMVWGLLALAAILLAVVASYARDAVTDPLSKLLNRRGFEQALAAVPLEGCMIVGDIDHFKRVNDRFGHLAGDAVIAGLAAIIAAALPPGGIAARTGGEEFAIFLPRATVADGAGLATQIRKRFAAADWGGIGVTTPLTASFGVAPTRPGDRGVHEVTSRADQGLYAAKNAGRNRIVTHDPPAGIWLVPEIGVAVPLRAPAR